MESHAAARPAPARTLVSVREAVRRLFRSTDAAIALALAAALAAAAFIANGGLQLGTSTLVEVAVIVIGALMVATALMVIGFQARLHGGLALGAMAALAALTALSIAWSLHPADSWVETNRSLAYLAAFGAGVAAVRISRGRWNAVLAGVLLALAAICLWGLATKIAPAWLAPDETYGRLREPYGYWNAVGVTAAMGIPICLWLATREGGARIVNALAWPLLALFTVTLLLSFSRGSIVAAAAGIAIWLIVVPVRLRSLALLLPSLLAAGAVTAWAFSRSALTDDRIPLADRKDAGIELGLILLAMVVVLFAAGVLIQRRAERRPLAEPTRRRIGTAAIALVAVIPVLVLGALAFSDRGIGGTFSDRWHDLTQAAAVTPQNSPGRLTETASVRSIYWRRAIDVWQDHSLAGAGAGSFAQAQLRYRKEQARAKHAHGYVLQTLADLGLIGLAVSLALLAAWALAARNTLDLRRGRTIAGGARWGRERVGLVTLALVAVVFGVHSAIDWTWFVPAVTITALFCAGWVAGRGPIGSRPSEPGPPALETARASLPRGRLLYERAALAVPVLVVAALAALAVAQPWRAEEKGSDALRLVAQGDYARAHATAEQARDINPLSPEPYFELAAVEDARGDSRAAVDLLEHAVQVEPANAEAWLRLGNYLLATMSDPTRALPVLRGAIYLDPLSDAARNSYLLALRADRLERTRRLGRTRRQHGR